MAYGLLYYNEITTLQFGRLVRIEILERDYTGSYSEIKMDAIIDLGDPGQDLYDPIRKKIASLEILSTKSLEFEHLFTADDQKYRVDIYRAGDLKFSGFIEADTYSEPYAFYENYNINITVRDRLGAIENTPYSLFGSDLRRVDFALDSALQSTGVFLSIEDNIELFSSSMSEILSTLEQSYLNQRKYINDDGTNESYLFVLKDILSAFGSQIRQVGNKWIIEEQAKFFNRPKVYVDSIYPDFKAGEIIFPPHPTRDTRWINVDSRLNLLSAWKEFTINHDYKQPLNIFKEFPKDAADYFSVPGPQGAKGLTDWTFDTITYVRRAGGDGSYILLLERAAGSGGYIENTSLPVTASTIEDLEIKFRVKIPPKTYGRFWTDIYTTTVTADIILGNKILSPSGWVTYTGSEERLLQFENISTTEEFQDLTVLTDAIPNTGNLTIRLFVPDDGTDNPPRFEYQDVLITVKNRVDEANATSQTLVGEIDTLNNFIPPSINLELGESPSGSNAESHFYGGLFDSSGTSLTDWKRSGDASTRNLLQVVGEGYDILNKQVSRQISGSLFWDWDFWTNIEDQGRTLMLNSGSWNLADDIITGEWVEVFEYKNEVGAFDDGFDEGFENSDAAEYKTNTIFTLTEKFE